MKSPECRKSVKKPWKIKREIFLKVGGRFLVVLEKFLGRVV